MEVVMNIMVGSIASVTAVIQETLVSIVTIAIQIHANIMGVVTLLAVIRILRALVTLDTLVIHASTTIVHHPRVRMVGSADIRFSQENIIRVIVKTVTREIIAKFQRVIDNTV